jgi:hypothetical protein
VSHACPFRLSRRLYLGLLPFLMSCISSESSGRPLRQQPDAAKPAAPPVLVGPVSWAAARRSQAAAHWPVWWTPPALARGGPPFSRQEPAAHHSSVSHPRLTSPVCTCLRDWDHPPGQSRTCKGKRRSLHGLPSSRDKQNRDKTQGSRFIRTSSPIYSRSIGTVSIAWISSLISRTNPSTLSTV